MRGRPYVELLHAVRVIRGSWARRLFLLCLVLASIHMVSNACQPGGSQNQCNARGHEASQEASPPLVV